MNGVEITWGLIGAAIILMIVIILLHYPEYILNKRKLLRKKLNQLRQSGQTVITKKPQNWLWLILSVLIVLGFVTAVYFAGKFILLKIGSAFEKIEGPSFDGLPDWLSSILTNWLFWVILAVLIASIFFRKKVVGEIRSRTIDWSWPKIVLWTIFAAIVIWFTYPRLMSRYNNEKAQQTTVSANSSDDVSSPRPFIIAKENSMRAGIWYTFTQQPGEPLFKFKPATPNTTITYQIMKEENKTREWSVEVWTDANNKAFTNSLNKDGIEPNDASKVGYSRIRVNKDAIVVSYVE